MLKIEIYMVLLFRLECILSAEYVLAMLQEALSDPVFVVDYKRIYPVVNDIDVVSQACPDL